MPQGDRVVVHPRLFAFVGLAWAAGLVLACGGDIGKNDAASRDMDASAPKRDADASDPNLVRKADGGPTGAVCNVDGVPHESNASGEGFPCPDGCNTCWCGADGHTESTLVECRGCWPPRQLAPGAVCTGEVVYAKNPNDGTCCPYAAACYAPAWLGPWKTFSNETECQNAGR